MGRTSSLEALVSLRKGEVATSRPEEESPNASYLAREIFTYIYYIRTWRTPKQTPHVQSRKTESITRRSRVNERNDSFGVIGGSHSGKYTVEAAVYDGSNVRETINIRLLVSQTLCLEPFPV